MCRFDAVCVLKKLDAARSEEGVWDWSLPPPVAETGRRNVGNRKEREARLCEFPGIWSLPPPVGERAPLRPEGLGGVSILPPQAPLNSPSPPQTIRAAALNPWGWPRVGWKAGNDRKRGLGQSRFHLVLFIPFMQREAKKGLEPAAASGGNRQAERRKPQGARSATMRVSRNCSPNIHLIRIPCGRGQMARKNGKTGKTG